MQDVVDALKSKLKNSTTEVMALRLDVEVM